MARIGAKLRDLRTRRRLSARALAARSGVSHSAISLIERDRISPSIDTLGAILDTLGTTFSAFFRDVAPAVAPGPFYEAAELLEIGDSGTISHRMVGADRPDRALLVLHERYAPGADTGAEIAHPAEEAGVVVRGEVELTAGERTRRLRAGDAYYFDSRLPHRFRNPSEAPCEIVSAVTPPTY